MTGGVCYASVPAMASKISASLGDRDKELLDVLRFNPFTAEELFSLSSTFSEPFTSVDYLQKRLRQLGSSGHEPRDGDLLRWWPYATASRGMLHYYKLTLQGHRTCYGDAAVPPRSFFRPVPLARQEHTRAIAAFLTQTITAAHQCGIVLTDFYPENHYRIEAGGQTHAADGRFTLVMGQRRYSYLLEIDNGTERIRSRQDVDSLQRMARLYEQHQAACYREDRSRVLFVATKSPQRVDQFLEVAAEERLGQNRTLFYGCHLPEYLECPDPLRETCFWNVHGEPSSLLPATKDVERFVGQQLVAC